MRRPWILGMAAVTAGCTNMSGLSGGSGYACKAPEGVACDSMSGVYANAVTDRLPGRRATSIPPPPAPASPQTPPTLRAVVAPTATIGASPTSASSLRSAPRVLRLWVKPWEDADGDLIDQSYVYVQVDSGQWLIDHAQRQIREAYAPVKPPPRLLRSDASPDAGPGPQRPPAASPPKATGLPRPPSPFDAED